MCFTCLFFFFLTFLRGLVIVFPEPAFSDKVHISFSTLTFLSINSGDMLEQTASGQGQAAAKGGKAKPLAWPAHHPLITLMQRQGWPFPPLSYPHPDGVSTSHLQPCLRAEGPAPVYRKTFHPISQRHWENDRVKPARPAAWRRKCHFTLTDLCPHTKLPWSSGATHDVQ